MQNTVADSELLGKAPIGRILGRLAFPIAETVTGGVGLILYVKTLRRWRRETVDKSPSHAV